ncbi:MAG TPA: PQQ-binding-like beta-propeller repeat protein [Phycisphaerae bacterium]
MIVFSAHFLAPAVVPVFVSAGAALMPAIAAGFASFFSLLIRPKLLWAACRRSPGKSALILAILIIIAAAPFAMIGLMKARAEITPPPPKQIDWPAVAREVLRIQSSPHDILQQIWHNPLDGELCLATPTPYTSADGKTALYVPAMINTVEKQAGTFWSLDAATGRPLWKATHTMPASGAGISEELRPIFSRPLVVANGTRVVTGQGLHDNANCSLLCFDVAASLRAGEGRTAWTVPTTLHLESSPALLTAGGGERVVIGAGAIEGPDKKAIGDPGYVFCVAVGSGEKLWQFPLNDPEACVAIDEVGIIYAGAGLNGNAVVALRSGVRDVDRQIWRYATKFPATGDLKVMRMPHDSSHQIVLLGTGNGDYVNADPHPAGSVLAIDASNGKLVWENALPDGVLGGLNVEGESVLAACRDGCAYKLDLLSGQIIWKTRISAGKDVPVLAGLVSDGRYAFALAADATLAVLDLQHGVILERRQLIDPSKAMLNFTMATPTLDRGILYVPTETSGIYAFDIGW